jgi:hypothetical protein
MVFLKYKTLKACLPLKVEKWTFSGRHALSVLYFKKTIVALLTEVLNKI